MGLGKRSVRAQGIESATYSHFDGTTAAYKAKIRSIFVNLKDKNNPGLRESVVSGEIPSEKLPTMTSEDMASEERKAADLKIKDANFFNSLGAEEQQAETDAFQCSRCKQVGVFVTVFEALIVYPLFLEKMLL